MERKRDTERETGRYKERKEERGKGKERERGEKQGETGKNYKIRGKKSYIPRKRNV